MTSSQAQTEPGASTAVQLRRFGEYVLVRKLAEGGMAEIFLAKRLGADGFECNVVIKKMLAHLSGMPDFVAMFRDEAQLAAKLRHPNIVQIQKLDFEEGCYFICMEYLAGEDFSTTVRTASFRGEYVPIPFVLRILADAARGLHYAHEFTDESGRPLNIVHRDISPSNLYVTYDGQVKVLDFGIAKAESRLAHTRTGVVKGKYVYMAPEQAQGHEVDRRADVFSLGVSLYEALTHVRPFARDNDLAVLKALLNSEFERPRALRPDLSPELEAVVLKAMAYEPANRHATAAEFADDLERLLAREPLAPTGATLGKYLRDSFGEERYEEKTRPPTLAMLGQSGLSVPGTSAGSSRPVPVKTATHLETRTGIVPPPPVTNSSPAGASRKRRLVLGLLAATCLLLLAGGAFVMGRNVRTPPEAVTQPVAPPVVEATPPPSNPTPAPGPGTSGTEAQPSVQSPPPQEAPAAEPEAPVAQPAPPAVKEQVRPAKRVTLDAADIQRVVTRNRTRIMTCFEQYKRDLPSDEGTVQVRFTIYSSGRASASTEGPLANKSVGRCLEKQVERLRFPAHKDKEVTVVLPFGYRVTR